MSRLVTALLLAAAALVPAACGGDNGPEVTQVREPSAVTVELAGTDLLGGLARNAGERLSLNSDVEAEVVEAPVATAVGRLCGGEIPIAVTDRRIAPAERRRCEVTPVELPAGFHAVAVARSPEFPVACLSGSELARLWHEGSRIDRLSELAGRLPRAPLVLLGPDPGSPSVPFFSRALTGRPGALRDDYKEVAERRVFIERLGGSERAVGFFNYAEINSAAPADLRLVAIDNGGGCVEPSFSAIRTGRYSLLSRPLYLYTSRAALRDPEVSRYLRFLYENYEQSAKTATQTVPLAPAQTAAALRRLPAVPAPG